MPSTRVLIAGGSLTPAAWRVCGRFFSTVSDPSWPKSCTTWLIPSRTGFTVWMPPLIAFWIAVFASARSQTLSSKDGFWKSNGVELSMYPWKAPLKTAASALNPKPLWLNESVPLPSANVYEGLAIFTPPAM